MNDFNCTSCGACCKLVTKEFLDKYDLPESPSGGCGHLMPDMKCAIYRTRPDVCNVRTTWEKEYSNYAWEAFKIINEDACRLLEKEMGDRYGNT